MRSKRGSETLQTLCPFIVLTLEVTRVDEVHKLFGELLKSAMLKVSHLEDEKTKF
jgi:hypothetical protein